MFEISEKLENGSIFINKVVKELNNSNNSLKHCDIEGIEETVEIHLYEDSILNKNWIVRFLEGTEFKEGVVDLEIVNENPEAFSGYNCVSIVITTNFLFKPFVEVIYKN